MKTNWQIKKLGEVCDIVNGSTPLRSNKTFWDHGDVSWFTIDDIREQGRVIKYTKQKITKKALGKTSVRLLPPESVLLCCTASVGEYAVTKISLTTNQQFNGLVVKDKKFLDPVFLFYFSSTLKDQLLGLSGKTTIDFIPISRLKGIEISLPSLPEQHRIVKILDEVFEKTAKAKENAEKNLQNAKELFDNYLYSIFTNNSRGWEFKKLSEVAEYFNGLTYSPKDVSDKGIIVLRSSNVQNDELDFSDIVRVDKIVKDKIIVHDGDILMCSRNGSKRLVGKTATISNLKEKMTFGTFMMIIRSNQNFYLKWFFKSSEFRRQITSGENTMINQITRYMLDDVIISFPPPEKQKPIVKKLNALSTETKKLEAIYKQKLADLEELKKSVLKKAFSGNL